MGHGAKFQFVLTLADTKTDKRLQLQTCYEDTCIDLNILHKFLQCIRTIHFSSGWQKGEVPPSAKHSSFRLAPQAEQGIASPTRNFQRRQAPHTGCSGSYLEQEGSWLNLAQDFSSQARAVTVSAGETRTLSLTTSNRKLLLPWQPLQKQHSS